jgi:hypothetical protein
MTTHKIEAFGETLTTQSTAPYVIVRKYAERPAEVVAFPRSLRTAEARLRKLRQAAIFGQTRYELVEIQRDANARAMRDWTEHEQHSDI